MLLISHAAALPEPEILQRLPTENLRRHFEELGIGLKEIASAENYVILASAEVMFKLVGLFSLERVKRTCREMGQRGPQDHCSVKRAL